jgi:hypothetical protein
MVCKCIVGETIANWGSCVATMCADVDPRRVYWLYDLLFDMCDWSALSSQTAFVQSRQGCSRALRIPRLQSAVLAARRDCAGRMACDAVVASVSCARRHTDAYARLSECAPTSWRVRAWSARVCSYTHCHRCLGTLVMYDVPAMYVDASLSAEQRPPRVRDIVQMFNGTLGCSTIVTNGVRYCRSLSTHMGVGTFGRVSTGAEQGEHR